MCDFIRAENIKSLLEHIVTKHLATVSGHSPPTNDKMHSNDTPTLEELSNPYGDTLAQLRKKYEENKSLAGGVKGNSEAGTLENADNDDRAATSNGKERTSNKKALEDQVRLTVQILLIFILLMR